MSGRYLPVSAALDTSFILFGKREEMGKILRLMGIYYNLSHGSQPSSIDGLLSESHTRRVIIFLMTGLNALPLA